MTASLKLAIEGIYCAFADVPRPTFIEGCPCCIEKKGIAILLSKPLRDLSPDELANYAASAFLTVGAVEDFLYYLPRILEILASTYSWWPSPEVVARAINDAGFPSWPPSRRNAILRYFDEVLNDLVAMENSGIDLDSWICALAKLHVDLDPILALIEKNRARLVELYEENCQALEHGGLVNGFWDDAPQEQYNRVVDWFQSQSADLQKAIQEKYGLEQ